MSGGVGSAVGFGGVSYGIAPRDWFLIEAGVGYGATGLQLSTMSKLTLGGDHDRLVSGLGLSVGILPNYAWFQARGATLWLNVDAVGYEHRFSGGLSIGAALGVAVGLAGGGHFNSSDICPAIHCNRGSGEYDHQVEWAGSVFPQARIQAGYWF